MATDKQINANRANAQLSTGPRTEAGKAIVKRNACTHGILSNELLLKGEERTELEELRSNLMEDYAPHGEIETYLVEAILDCLWKLKRIQRVEHCLLSQSLSEGGLRATNWAFEMNGGYSTRWDLLLKYQATIERKMEREIEKLEKKQRARVSESTEPDHGSAGVISSDPETIASHAKPQSVEREASSPPAIILGSAVVSHDSAAVSVSTTSGKVITNSDEIIITNSMPEVSQSVNTGNSSTTTVPDVIPTSSNTPHVSVVATVSGIVTGIEARHNVTSISPIQNKVEDSMGT